MKASLSFCAVAVLGGLAAPARAQVSLHDTPWYMQHSAERGATLRLCHKDDAMARTPDCVNAEAAVTRLHAQSLGRQWPIDDMLNDPQYWQTNRIARASQLNACAKGLWGSTPSSCAAARAGEAADGNWVTRGGK